MRSAAALGVIGLVWLLDMLSIVVVFDSLHVDISTSGALFVLFIINLSIAAPTTPANIGPLQLGALLATRMLGIPSEPALAFALLYHAIQIFPLLLVGFVLEFRLVIPGGTRGKLTA
jgi:glycosyltransferase 2 family protein